MKSCFGVYACCIQEKIKWQVDDILICVRFLLEAGSYYKLGVLGHCIKRCSGVSIEVLQCLNWNCRQLGDQENSTNHLLIL